MSASAASLRRKIASSGDLQSVVRTMKALAASSISQYEASVLALGDYYRTVELGLGACLRQGGFGALREQQPRDAAVVGVVVFGSDQGLVGQFNEVVVDFAVQSLTTRLDSVRLWAVGERAQARLLDAGLSTTQALPVPNSVQAIAPLVLRVLMQSEALHGRGRIDELHVFYLSLIHI